MEATHGMVWWTELMTRDPDAARDYYTKLCGWEWDPVPMGTSTYWLGKRNGVPLVGVMDMAGQPEFDGTPPHWFSEFAVDDVDAACKATRAAGGKVLRDPWDVPGTGRIAILQDPTGAAMGLMTPAAQA